MSEENAHITLSEKDREKLVGHLKRFFHGNENETKSAIEAFLEENPQASFQEVFNDLSSGKGKGKSHMSDVREEEPTSVRKAPRKGR